MATVNVSVVSVGAPVTNGVAQTIIGASGQSGTMTSSGTSAEGSLAAQARQVFQIDCDTALYVRTGPASGTAVSASNGVYAKANQTMYLSADTGDVLYVIDA